MGSYERDRPWKILGSRPNKRHNTGSRTEQGTGSSPFEGSVRLQDPAKWSVWLLKTLLLYSEVDKKKVARPFKSVKLQRLRPRWIIEYDGSLDGIGINGFEVSAAGVETAVGCASIDIGFLELRIGGSTVPTGQWVTERDRVPGVIHRDAGAVAEGGSRRD